MGYLNFDKVRYWDIRDKDKIHFPLRKTDVVPDALPSDSLVRTDRLFLEEKTIEEA